MDLSTAIKLKNSTDSIPIDTHFKLCAGPGAGKTTFLINHIRNILSRSTRLSKTKKIACITYTNTGVETILKRLENISTDVEVSTIHSFLYTHVVKPYLWLLDNIIFPLDKLDGHDEIKPGYSILKEFKERSNQKWISDNQALSKALSKLTWSINDNKEIELKFLKPHHGKLTDKTSVKKESYIVYKKLCWEHGMLSHDDVLYFSYLLIKRYKRIREIVRAKFPYFLIDEFQDTSPLQVEIIKLIAEKEMVLGVIGDPCQSIFSFQGASERSFSQFSLKEMVIYSLESNYRSTQQIVSVLNYLRNDESFVQYSPKKKSGNTPTILIGDAFTSYYEFKKNCSVEKWCVLGYRNETANSIEYSIEDLIFTDIDNLFYKDGNRSKIIYYAIHAIEYGRQLKMKEALKFMKKIFKSVENFSEKDSFVVLKRLLNEYKVFNSMNIKEFYNTYIYNCYGIKQEIKSGKIKDYYESLQYNQVASLVNIADDNSSFKTIHKAKGDEFDNILLIIPKSNCTKFLKFLLSPDMKNEEHRVYYVALSRAKNSLYINIPTIPENEMNLIKKFNKKVLSTNLVYN
ncbi:ATP-dependent helicase [Bacillus wiedmannii]|uniref:ATP-dependent helicase n=1 Tax=Bacillus wiedmannii TaxID=1890302 RepID=UPI000BF75FF3|nr:ATP-dependent helicase [Bacillus wiedmannii]MDM5264830.1 ATP-dependent helicase [Bacillus wiedmannii]PFZ86153.1 DNA helicase [Bacillus wiedmannii]